MEEPKVYEVREAIADPSTLGLASFGIGLFTLSFYNAGIVGENSMSIIVPLALITGLIHFFVALYGFRKNELFTVVVFGIYGMFWAVYALINIGVATKLFVLDVPTLLIFLIAYTIFTFYVLIASLATNKAVILTLTGLLLVFVFLDLGVIVDPSYTVWGGYLGIGTALLALYTSASGIIGSTYGRSVLPVGPVKTHSS